MRTLTTFLLSSVLILTAGCMALRPTPTAPPYQLGSPVLSQANAVTVANGLLENQDFKWIGAPTTALAEELSFAESNKILGGAEPEYERWGPDTRVWLVIFRGQWTVQPMGPPGAAPIPYQGCLFVVFDAADGAIMQMGDAVCPTSP